MKIYFNYEFQELAKILEMKSGEAEDETLLMF